MRSSLPLLQRCQRLLVRAGMFDNLSQRLDKAWDLVRKDGKLTADNIKEPMREIRRALLEADVCPLLFALAPGSLCYSADRQYPEHISACLSICMHERHDHPLSSQHRPSRHKSHINLRSRPTCYNCETDCKAAGKLPRAFTPFSC